MSLFGTRQLKEGMRIFMEIFGDPYAGVYRAQILEVVKNSDFTVGTPNKNGMIIPLPKGEIIRCFYFEEERLFEFYVRIVDRALEPEPILKLEYPKNIKESNRRQYDRVECSIPVTMRILPLPSATWRDQDGMFIDISAGGGMILTSYPFEDEQNIELTISFPRGPRVRVFGYVRRADVKVDKYLVGVQFITLTEDERMRFYEYAGGK